MAYQTANKEYQYDAIYHKKPLYQWVDEVHKYMSKEMGWKYYPLKKGAFGFDNLVISIAYTFDKEKKLNNIDTVANLVHEGWIQNYSFWRDFRPFDSGNLYFEPAKALGDERRELCCDTEYKDLPEEEKEKDKMIAKYLIKSIKTNKK